MHETGWVEEQARLSLKRLLPRVHSVFDEASLPQGERDVCERRLNRHWRRLFESLFQLYSSDYDFFYQLEQLLLAFTFLLPIKFQYLMPLKKRGESLRNARSIENPYCLFLYWSIFIVEKKAILLTKRDCFP